MAKEKENSVEQGGAASKTWEEALQEKSQSVNRSGSKVLDTTGKRGVELLVDKILQTSIRLPMLEITYDRLLRISSASLRNYTSDNVDLEILSMKTERFSDCLSRLSSPSMLSVFKVVEWDNFGIFTMDSQMIYSFVELLFGGRKVPTTLKVEGRPFTSIESSVVRSVTEIMLHDLSTAFNSFTSATFQLDRIETNPKFAMVVRPEDVVVTLTIKVQMDTRSGTISIILPYSTIEPVKKILAKPYIGERGSKDPNWTRHFENEVSKASVKLDVILTSEVAELKDVAAFKVGKTIMLDKPVGSEWSLQLGGRVVAAGQPGKIGDKLAVQLTSDLTIQMNRN